VREPDADDELLALLVAQREEAVPEANHLGCRTPGMRQRPDPDGSRALGRARVPAVEPAPREQPEKG
jgi:hypothetical protein